MLIGILTGMGATVLGAPRVKGADWRERFSVLHFRVVCGESEGYP